MNQNMESSNKSVSQTSDFPIFSTSKYFEHIVLLYWVLTACILKKKETWIEDPTVSVKKDVEEKAPT